MRTTSVLVAALVAAVSVAGQEETSTRRIYFPRHIKRQFSNATITSLDSAVPSESREATSQSTKRDDSLVSDFSDLINSLASLNLPTPAGAGTTTVVIQSTVVVPPTPTAAAANNGTSSEPTLTSDVPLSQETGETGTKGPVLVSPSRSGPSESASKTETDTKRPADTVVSVAPPTTTSTTTPITIAPTGIVSDSSATTPAPETTKKDPLDPLTSLVSDIVSVITSVAPPLQNGTEATTKLPEVELPSSTLVTIPPVSPSGTGVVPSVTEPPPLPSSETQKPSDPPPIPSSTVIDPPPISNTTEPPVPSSTPPPVISSSVTPPPSSFSSVPPNPPIGNSTVSNTTVPEPTTTEEPSVGVTSIPHLGSTTQSQSWLPTTILVDPTSTTVKEGLAPTTATGIPTAYPKAITPESGLTPQPDDTGLIQIGLLEGYNYPFVVGNTKAAAQIFSLLPQALGYTVDDDLASKIQMRKLIPLDTSASMGFITTLAIVTFPNSMIEALRVDVKVPSSPLYNNPEMLVFNFTKQINPSIDITMGSYPEDVPGATDSDSPTTGSSTPNGDPFSNEGPGNKSSSQQGTTAAIVGGSVFVAAAYGAVMFVIARRYKKKKQAHRRASSISNTSSEMRQTPRGSPPLMGGALLSRDFTGYGGVAGGRDSHGSGRSGMNSSSRTQYISAPVAAENSLGWN